MKLPFCFNNSEFKQELEDKTLQRMDSFVTTFNELVAQKRLSGVYLNKGTLYCTIQSYFIDIYRMKCFHNIEHANRHKKAAFTMTWIARLKPIMIEKNVSDKDLSSIQLLANEYFALMLGLNFLEIDADKITERFIIKMLYILRYRNIESLILSLLLELVETSENG